MQYTNALHSISEIMRNIYNNRDNVPEISQTTIRIALHCIYRNKICIKYSGQGITNNVEEKGETVENGYHMVNGREKR